MSEERTEVVEVEGKFEVGVEAEVIETGEQEKFQAMFNISDDTDHLEQEEDSGVKVDNSMNQKNDGSEPKGEDKEPKSKQDGKEETDPAEESKDKTNQEGEGEDDNKDKKEEQKKEEPQPPKPPKPKIYGRRNEKKVIKYAGEKNLPVLMVGETGVGKTYVLREVAAEQGQKVTRVSVNGEVGINEFIGKWLIKGNGDGSTSTYWQNGVLTEAMIHGHWLVVDEINAALPEILFSLHSVLDDEQALVLAEKDGSRIVPHENFRLFATMNPPDEYAGTKELNKALLSRFPIVLEVPQYQPKTEVEIIKYHTSLNDEHSKMLVNIANALRKSKNDHKTYYSCSTRDLIQCAGLMKSELYSIGDCLKWSLINKADKEDQKNVTTVIGKSIPKEVNLKDKAKIDYDPLVVSLANDKKALTEEIVALENKRDQIQEQVINVEKAMSAFRKTADF